MRVCEIRLSELRCQYQTVSQKVLKEEPPRKRLLFSTSHAGHQAKRGRSCISASAYPVSPISNRRSQISKRWQRKFRDNCALGASHCKSQIFYDSDTSRTNPEIKRENPENAKNF